MKEYKPILNLLETEIAIKFVKDNFERLLGRKLGLTRVSAPLFVVPESGLNDNLNGYERAVRFDVKSIGVDVEIVQSLAKWKRMALKKYGFPHGKGLYTDMNAIRRDEDLDAIHSVYVDQWDWEKIISKDERSYFYLKDTVKVIYNVLKDTAKLVNKQYPELVFDLPKDITFISTLEMERKYPELTRKEREKKVAQMYKAVFIYQIGWPLNDGNPHDGRAADYDDWSLNGDIILWNDILENSFEISSMGIRVDENSLIKQLQEKREMHKIDNPYCQAILKKELPYTIGGGIGQSRLCMFFLKKAHIGEVQASIWSNEDIKALEAKNIHLL